MISDFFFSTLFIIQLTKIWKVIGKDLVIMCHCELLEICPGRIVYRSCSGGKAVLKEFRSFLCKTGIGSWVSQFWIENNILSWRLANFMKLKRESESAIQFSSDEIQQDVDFNVIENSCEEYILQWINDVSTNGDFMDDFDNCFIITHEYDPMPLSWFSSFG